MTTALYILFIGWLAGTLLISVVVVGLVAILGGRQEFTDLWNSMTNSHIEKHHMDWALVLAVVFWPNTIANLLLNRAARRATEKAKETVNEG